MKFQSAVSVLIMMISCLSSNSAWSDVTFDEKMGGLLYFSITNSIGESDYSYLVNIVKSVKKLEPDHPSIVLSIKLNSSGGKISSALKIGRYLRKHKAIIEVKERAECLSACIYVLAGAPHRVVHGSVGIHRPYEPDDNEISADAQKAKYQKIGKQIIAYLKEMNIPTRLYDDSLFINPYNMKILNNSEMQAYGLNEDDPYISEADDSRHAKIYGITRQEYAKRTSRTLHECRLQKPDDDNVPDSEKIVIGRCYDEIMNGTR